MYTRGMRNTPKRPFFAERERGAMPPDDARLAVLSYLSYAECWNPNREKVERGVRAAVERCAADSGVGEIVWGPVAYRKKGLLLTDSLMFAAKIPGRVGAETERYALVFRGTNPGSITSWIFQDLAVSGMVPWTRRSPKTKHRDAWISMAADTALDIHESLADGGKTAFHWLMGLLAADSRKRVALSLTGHSLGGLMSTAYGLYLRDELAAAGLEKRVEINVCAFAGPTAGNAAFSDALEKEFGNGLALYDNPLDIAPLAWEERNLESVIPVLYEPTIRPSKLYKEALSSFAAAVRGLGYDKPARRVRPVPSSIVEVPFNDYLLEAAVQHVASYAEEALRDAPESARDTVRAIVKKLLGVAQFAKFGKGPLFWIDSRKKGMRALTKLF